MWNAPHENFSEGKGRDKNLNVQGICEEFLRNCEENSPIWRELERNGDKNEKNQGINVPSFIADKLVTLPYGKERNQKQKATALH